MGCCQSTPHDISDLKSEGVSQERQDVDEEIIITSIRATDLALGLDRIPAGFYIVVSHSGLEWRTENKPTLVNSDVEWSEQIPIPSDPFTTVSLVVRASFEFQPMLGNGEQLRDLTVTVEQLLDRSARDLEFTFSQSERKGSPCSSLLVTVRRRENDSERMGILAPHRAVTGLQAHLDDMTDQGQDALSRYRKFGGEWNLELAIEHFQDVLSTCPPDHPCDVAAQANLAMARDIEGRVHNKAARFDVALSLYWNALVARPVGHPDRARTLVHLALVHFVRAAKQRNSIDTVDAEALLREAMDLSHAESHEHQAAVSILQMHDGRTMAAVQAGGQISLPQDPTAGVSDVLRLSTLLLGYFEQFGDPAMLEQAISLLAASIRSNLSNDQQDLAELATLGILLRHRFDHLGELSNLEEAISRQREAVRLAPDCHPHKSMFLHSLGNSLMTRYDHLGEPNDLEEAISSQRGAVLLTSDDRPDKPALLNNLAVFLMARFKRGAGDPGDLEEIIMRRRDAVDLAPDSDPEKGVFLNSLGNSLLTRFERMGQPSDLEEAISKQRHALDFIPNGHPAKPGSLNDLAISLVARFERVAGNLDDLGEAISRQRDAVDLTHDSDPEKAAFLNSLGNSLKSRFERLGEPSDLEEAISMQQDAVWATPDESRYKFGFLGNLSNSLFTRFERFGDLEDLEEAISSQRDAIDLTPEGHPDKIPSLNNLGMFLAARFGHLGELGDLEEGISWQKSAVELIPDDHPNKPSFLNNLCLSLLSHFERLGQLSDLEEAISRQRDAVHLTPDGQPQKPVFLNNLSKAFLTRYERLGELSDLGEATSGQRNAIGLTPEGHSDRPRYLHNLGAVLIARFKHRGHFSDLEEAISRQQDAVDLTPDGHSHKPGFLNNLGNSLRTRSERLEEPRDLEEAVLRLREAVRQTPDGHPEKPIHLQNLGGALRTRFESLEQQSDLEDAILTQGNAVDLTPDDHYNKPLLLCHLGECLLARFRRLGRRNDLERFISLLSQAACATAGPVVVRFHASRRWIFCSRQFGHQTLLDAHSVAVRLLPQLAWIGLSLAHRYSELVEAADVVRDAAAVALDSGRPEVAVEWLEQGRSIVWGEMFQLRSSYEDLSSAYPDHAHRLRELSAALEHAGASRERSIFSPSNQVPSPVYPAAIESLQEVANRHRALAIERDTLLEDIRKLPGFERFLLQRNFSELRSAACAGPVVILNAAETRCDALIVLADVDHVVHVPLSNFTLQRSIDLRTSLKGFVRDVRVARDDRDGRPIPREESSRLNPILASLWKCVVKPVLDALALSMPGGELPRIFWCPTGPLTFVPIHAAGFYDSHHSQPGHKVYDFVVSSYVPSLSILLLLLDPPQTTKLRLLAVPQPLSDGQSRLPGVVPEMEHIRAIIKNTPSDHISLAESTTGTVEEVLDLMKDAHWVHFACHGVQDSKHPTASGLCLADKRRLKLLDVISLSRPRGGLAFLSACQTAKGDEDLSDEATHIAAGMLYAGYGGVIGTMWSISDRHAPNVARDVYEQLLTGDTIPDYREAARALHVAVGRLRDNNVPFDDWIPFIHVGL